MAIKFDLPDSQIGIRVPDAYLRVVTVQINRTRDPEARFQVMIDSVPYARDPGDDDVQGVDFQRRHVSINEAGLQDVIGKIYDYLMSLPEFAGAVPV